MDIKSEFMRICVALLSRILASESVVDTETFDYLLNLKKDHHASGQWTMIGYKLNRQLKELTCQFIARSRVAVVAK